MGLGEIWDKKYKMHFLLSLSSLPLLSGGLTKKETSSLYVSLIFAKVIVRAEEAAHKYKVQLFILLSCRNGHKVNEKRLKRKLI